MTSRRRRPTRSRTPAHGRAHRHDWHDRRSRARHAATRDGLVRSGPGLAQRIGARSRLAIVDAILSGVHESGTSHYELLRAFADDATLGRADEALKAHGYCAHEFGDSVLIEKARVAQPADRAHASGATMTYDVRSNTTVLARRLGVAVRPASIQESE